MDQTRAERPRADDEAAGIPGPADRRSTTVPAALPDKAVLETSPLHDDGSLVPDQLHDAPEYIPAPLGMATGAIIPPVDPSEVGSSAWITTAPARRGRSFLSVVVTIGAVIIGLAVLAALVGANLNLFSQRGQIVFGTAAGDDVCSIRSQTTAISARDTVYYAAHLKSSVGPSETLTLRITRNGQEVTTDELPPYGSEFDCFGLKEPIGPLQPGVYVFEVLRAGVVEATGTLTVT